MNLWDYLIAGEKVEMEKQRSWGNPWVMCALDRNGAVTEVLGSPDNVKPWVQRGERASRRQVWLLVPRLQVTKQDLIEKRLSKEVLEQSARPLEVGSMPQPPQMHLHTPLRTFPKERVAQCSKITS